MEQILYQADHSQNSSDTPEELNRRIRQSDLEIGAVLDKLPSLEHLDAHRREILSAAARLCGRIAVKENASLCISADDAAQTLSARLIAPAFVFLPPVTGDLVNLALAVSELTFDGEADQSVMLAVFDLEHPKTQLLHAMEEFLREI